MIDGHGDDLYRYGGKIIHNFSSNIFQGIDHSGLKAHLASCLDTIANYPEPAPYSVEMLLAKKLGIPAENIMVTNGAADAIHIIARAYQGRKSAVLQPTFAEYADACKMSGHSVLPFYDIKAAPTDAELLWLCNPNNPTGKVYDTADVQALISANGNKLIVIDQAYHKYTHGKVVAPDNVLIHDNLILLYSMTKDYAIPGLRLGYIVSSKPINETLKAYRTPWSVNALAIEAAKFLLERDISDIDLDMLLDEVRRVACKLHDLGIATEPSDTNFMLCRLPKGGAADLKDYLALKHHTLIRDASNFEGLTPQHFRIAVQRPEDNDTLIKAISQWMQS